MLSALPYVTWYSGAVEDSLTRMLNATQRDEIQKSRDKVVVR